MDTDAEVGRAPESNSAKDKSSVADRVQSRPRWPSRHPLRFVAIVSCAIAVGHALWIVHNRHVGALDPDEAGYIATALRYQRSIDPRHAFDFIAAVGGTANGVVVPLLSVITLTLGSRNPQSAMMIQPILMVVCCVGVTAVSLRLMTSKATAIGAGLAFAVFPTTILATQSYWYGLGAAACSIVALWMLLDSDGCTNRRIWLFGICVGLTLLTRTMTLGFIPGFAVAALVTAGTDRRALRRAIMAMGLGGAIAAPIYIVNADAIFNYLFSYGYGKRAGLFGEGGPLERIGFRLWRILEGMGPRSSTIYVTVAAIAGVAWLLRNRHTAIRSQQARPMLAVGVFVALGFAALVSTTNNGVWFELPILIAVTPIIAAAISSLHISLRALCAAALVGMAAIQLPASWWLVEPQTIGFPPLVANHLNSTHYEHGFAQYDVRFDPSTRSLQTGAAREWAKVSDEVVAKLFALQGPQQGRLSFWLSGNFQLFNSNTVTLAGELQGKPMTAFVPETVESERLRARQLTPTYDNRPRVLIFALHNQHLFTPDAEVKAFYRQARRSGWEPVATFRLPINGRVEILTHPDND